MELNETIGTGERDQHGQPINLVQVPNEAVKRVLYTERTPPETVELIRGRLEEENNRYQAEDPRKLVLSTRSYDYREALRGSIDPPAVSGDQPQASHKGHPR